MIARCAHRPNHLEEPATRSPFPLATTTVARSGMSRRSTPDQTSCAAPARAQIGQGHHQRSHTNPLNDTAGRSPPTDSLTPAAPFS